jgi:hypothetical protein
VRAAAQDSAAANDLMLIGKAEIAFHNAAGTYSGSLSALTTLPSNIASGEADGHKFSILSSSREAFVARSIPIELGRTGLQTCTIDQTLHIGCWMDQSGQACTCLSPFLGQAKCQITFGQADFLIPIGSIFGPHDSGFG